MIRRVAWLRLLVGFIVAGCGGIALAVMTGGLSPSFIEADESAHYVNTLFIADWLRAGCPSPMPFARDFYAHFPKLSIGHWPPGWYALLAPGFALVRPSPWGAALFSAFVAGLPAAIAGWAVRRAGASRALAAGAAGATLILPLTVESARYFLLDQPVALIVGFAAFAWLAAAEQPSWCRFGLYGALAVFATLVKGNGALALLIAPLEIAVSRRWSLLADLRLWTVGMLALVPLVPWYVVSFRLSSDGFNYAPGLDYAARSLLANGAAVLGNMGIGGVILAAVGVAAGWREPRAGALVRVALAIVVATLAIQAAIPVALAPRYILPLLPWTVALAALGCAALWRWRRGARAVAAALVVAALWVPASALVALAPKPDLGADRIAAAMVARPGVWLVDGRSGGEGAVIAAAAWADRGARRLWVARASQWLSTSDFMGNNYRLTARTPAAATAVVDALGARGAVLLAPEQRYAFPHSRVLAAALASADWRTERTRFPRGAGTAIVATRIAPVTPHPDRLAASGMSRNLDAVTGR